MRIWKCCLKYIIENNPIIQLTPWMEPVVLLCLLKSEKNNPDDDVIGVTSAFSRIVIITTEMTVFQMRGCGVWKKWVITNTDSLTKRGLDFIHVLIDHWNTPLMRGTLMWGCGYFSFSLAGEELILVEVAGFTCRYLVFCTLQYSTHSSYTTDATDVHTSYLA